LLTCLFTREQLQDDGLDFGDDAIPFLRWHSLLFFCALFSRTGLARTVFLVTIQLLTRLQRTTQKSRVRVTFSIPVTCPNMLTNVAEIEGLAAFLPGVD